MKKMKIVLIIILFTFLIAITVRSAGQFLIVNEQPKKADVIIILSGEDEPRMTLGCTLFDKGYASHMILSGGLIPNTKTTYAEQMMTWAIGSRIPRNAIILEQQSDSTDQNAMYTKEIMVQCGFKSAIIVSTNYHMRRVKFLFDRAYRKTGITLIYCGAESPILNPQRWWANKDSIVVTFNEYCKLIGNAFGIEGHEDKIKLQWLDKLLFN